AADSADARVRRAALRGVRARAAAHVADAWHPRGAVEARVALVASLGHAAVRARAARSRNAAGPGRAIGVDRATGGRRRGTRGATATDAAAHRAVGVRRAWPRVRTLGPLGEVVVRGHVLEREPEGGPARVGSRRDRGGVG